MIIQYNNCNGIDLGEKKTLICESFTAAVSSYFHSKTIINNRTKQKPNSKSWDSCIVALGVVLIQEKCLLLVWLLPEA